MLPKISHPSFEFVVPSTGKKELFRPFLVKEEKILLMSKTSEDSSEIFRSIKQVINNCAISENFDIDKLTIFDLEYIFLQIRAVSINSITKVSYRDNEDGEIYSFDVDLTKLEVKFPINIDKVIKITDKVGIKMKYPSASIFDDKEFFSYSGEDSFYELMLRCIDKIYNEDDLFDPKDYSKQELEEFMDQLDVKIFEKIQNFMNNIPRLYHTLEYVNKNGNPRIITMNSLNDFFTLGWAIIT